MIKKNDWIVLMFVGSMFAMLAGIWFAFLGIPKNSGAVIIVATFIIISGYSFYCAYCFYKKARTVTP